MKKLTSQMLLVLKDNRTKENEEISGHGCKDTNDEDYIPSLLQDFQGTSSEGRSREESEEASSGKSEYSSSDDSEDTSGDESEDTSSDESKETTFVDYGGMTHSNFLKKFEIVLVFELKKVSKCRSLRDVLNASHIFPD